MATSTNPQTTTTGPNSPKTGVNGVGAPIAILLTAVAAAFMVRSRRDDE
ncbi:MAG: NPXTG-anchored protein [Ruminococcus sp.]|nr:NPXTG-anchored protein [Ruminococcus sp.]